MKKLKLIFIFIFCTVMLAGCSIENTDNQSSLEETVSIVLDDTADASLAPNPNYTPTELTRMLSGIWTHAIEDNDVYNYKFEESPGIMALARGADGSGIGVYFVGNYQQQDDGTISADLDQVIMSEEVNKTESVHITFTADKFNLVNGTGVFTVLSYSKNNTAFEDAFGAMANVPLTFEKANEA